VNRKQQKVIEYLLEENRVLKQQFESTGKKLRLDNHQRRNLAKRGKAMGWPQLLQYATSVRPGNHTWMAPEIGRSKVYGKAQNQD
jgi:hypothetical protein